MKKMSIRIFNIASVIFLIFFILRSSDEKTLSETSNVSLLSKRSESLSKLLQLIVDEHFGGCVLIILYDENFSNKSVALEKIFQGLSHVSYIQKTTNLTSKRPVTISIDKCYNYIIFLDNIHGIGGIIVKESLNKVIVVTESTPWTVKEFLKGFGSRSYTNLLIITHSMSRRTEDGSFLLYTHKLYTDGSGASQPILLTSWIKDHTTHNKINLFPEKLSGGFKGHRLLISTAHKPPFAIRTNIISQKNIDWDGIDVRLIRLIGKTLNFTIDFRDPVSPDSPIYATLTDVSTGQAAAAAGGIYKTENITTRFDASVSHMEDCAAFISQASLALPKYRAVFGPFQPGVWVLVCSVYLIAIIPLTMNTNYTFRSFITHPSRLVHMFWYVFSTFTNSFVVKNPLLNYGIAKNSTSLLIGVYWVFTIIITSCYTGSIMAFITVPMFPEPTDSAAQLLDEGYTIGTLDHDGWEQWFNYTDMDNPVASKLLESLEYVPTEKEGIRNSSEAFFWSYAFLGSKISMEYIVQADFTPNWKTMRSTMHISRECFINFGVTLVLPKDSIYTEPINKVVIQARQSGLIQKIIRDVKWDIQRTAEGTFLPVSEEYNIRKLPVEDRQLALDDTQGMFLILGAGFILACFSITMECCVHVIKKRHCRSVTATTIVSTIGSPISTARMSHLEVPQEAWNILTTTRPRGFSWISI